MQKIRVLKGGKVIKKVPRFKLRKRVSLKMKMARKRNLIKARKKAHTSSAKRSRRMSMVVRKRRGLTPKRKLVSKKR